MLIVGVDTGGTFTDFVYLDEKGNWGLYKTLSTPHNPAVAVLKGLKEIGNNQTLNITHGSTVATNAVLERKGAKTAFITNKGFEDIIYIGRQNRAQLYNLYYKKPKPLVEKSFGLDCRVNSLGEIIKDLSKEELERLVKTLKEEEFEAVAVSFLFSFQNPIHEKKVKERFEKEGFFVSISSEIVPEFREYERSSTTVINSYVMPKMYSYINFLEENIKPQDTLKIIQSNGGIISPDVVKRQPVRTILSGPAGGVVGALYIGKLAGYEKLITFDMGGTSTDVSLIDRQPSISTESYIEGFPVKVPMIDIHTVGAGGGSIAYIDKGGALQVGPESAGADPGPICYGKGERPTVTDANLFLGRLIPEFFLGGKMKLYPDRVKKIFTQIAEQIGLSPVEFAEGILEVANTKMERALRKISVEKGYNPKEFILFSFGGAGGLHAVFLAKMLEIPRVLVSPNPGTLSALGMLMADIVKDYSLTVLQENTTSYKTLFEMFQILEKKSVDEMQAEGFTKADIKFERFLDVRYKGQSYELTIPFTKDFIHNFHQTHEKVYGYKNPNKQVEVVNIRLKASVERRKPNIPTFEFRGKTPLEEALLFEREVIFDGKPYKTKVYDRDKLLPGNEINGSAIIVEYSSTIVVPPFAKATVDKYKNLIISY